MCRTIQDVDIVTVEHEQGIVCGLSKTPLLMTLNDLELQNFLNPTYQILQHRPIFARMHLPIK